MPTVPKKPGPTSLYIELVSVSGLAAKPCTETPLPQLLPASSGTSAPAAPLTPGIAASSSSTRSNSAFDRSGV